jgi:hypothetical protein
MLAMTTDALPPHISLSPKVFAATAVTRPAATILESGKS